MQAPTQAGLPRLRWPETLRSSSLPGALLAAVLIALLVQPMVVNRTFIGFDWYAHLWYIAHAEETLRDYWWPTLYVHNTAAVFDPHYAFYGGTLYTLAGAISLVAGSPERGFVICWVLGFASAYGGWFWLARQAGAGRWAAHLPGVLFVTSPYYLATIYAGASWGELMAVSSIPLLLAAMLDVLRAERLRPGPALALAVSCIVVTGSHNLTLLWASTLLAVFFLATLALVPASRRLVTARGLRRVAVIAVPAVLVNAWFLVPDVVLQGRTKIANDAYLAEEYLYSAMHMLTPGKLLSLGRASNDAGIPHYSLQLPLLAGGWVVAGLAVLRSGWRGWGFRVALIALAIAVSMSVLMMRLTWLLDLPRPYGLLQFGFRLEAYVQLAVAAAVVAVLALAGRAGTRGRIWAAVLVPVAIASVVQGLMQIHQPNPERMQRPEWPAKQPYHTASFAPGSGDYAAVRLPLVAATPDLPPAVFPVADIERTGRATVTVGAYAGQVIRSNVVAAPDLVRLRGASFFGRDANGTALLTVDEAATSGTARITVEAKHPWPVVVGRALSALGLLLLAGAGVVLGRRSRRLGRG